MGHHDTHSFNTTYKQPENTYLNANIKIIQ